ncbi:hypothetical protein Tco_0227823, partial [Tanacetum coccineum]
LQDILRVTAAQVIVNGDAPTIASASAGTEGPIPPKTVAQKLAKKNELKAKSTNLEIHCEVTLKEECKSKFAESPTISLEQYYFNHEKTNLIYTQWQDDLYNHRKGFMQSKIKCPSSLSSKSQNVAFVSSENTSSTNEAVYTAHEVSTASLQGQASSLTYAYAVMFSFFANQSNSPQLDNEDLDQIDTDDLEEMDLK